MVSVQREYDKRGCLICSPSTIESQSRIPLSARLLVHTRQVLFVAKKARQQTKLPDFDMAEHLVSIFGTEKDKVNCPFYYKIGACRHGDRCSRVHNKPRFSQTILLENLYLSPDQIIASARSQGLPEPDIPEEDLRYHFDDFYEDIHEEMTRYGSVESVNVCENLAEHLAGNTYVKFRDEESAQAALSGVNGRWYAGRPVKAEFSPVTDFREGKCRPFERRGVCDRGDYCHFMHLRRHPGNAARSGSDRDDDHESDYQPHRREDQDGRRSRDRDYDRSHAYDHNRSAHDYDRFGDRERERDRDYPRDIDRERERERIRDRVRTRGYDRDREHDRNRGREEDGEWGRALDRGRDGLKRDWEGNGPRENERDRDRNRDRDRHRGHDRDSDRARDKDEERRARRRNRDRDRDRERGREHDRAMYRERRQDKRADRERYSD